MPREVYCYGLPPANPTCRRFDDTPRSPSFPRGNTADGSGPDVVRSACRRSGGTCRGGHSFARRPAATSRRPGVQQLLVTTTGTAESALFLPNALQLVAGDF